MQTAIELSIATVQHEQVREAQLRVLVVSAIELAEVGGGARRPVLRVLAVEDECDALVRCHVTIGVVERREVVLTPETEGTLDVAA